MFWASGFLWPLSRCPLDATGYDNNSKHSMSPNVTFLPWSTTITRTRVMHMCNTVTIRVALRAFHNASARINHCRLFIQTMTCRQWQSRNICSNKSRDPIGHEPLQVRVTVPPLKLPNLLISSLNLLLQPEAPPHLCTVDEDTCWGSLSKFRGGGMNGGTSRLARVGCLVGSGLIYM